MDLGLEDQRKKEETTAAWGQGCVRRREAREQDVLWRARGAFIYYAWVHFSSAVYIYIYICVCVYSSKPKTAIGRILDFMRLTRSIWCASIIVTPDRSNSLPLN
jgi:hypothetical protein